MRLMTIATLLAVASALQACTHEERAHSEVIFQALGADPLPDALQDDPVPSVAEPVAPVVEEPPPPPSLQYGDPGYVPAYMEKGYKGPEPCPGSIFRVLTCDDNGQDWHWLDSNMNWIN